MKNRRKRYKTLSPVLGFNMLGITAGMVFAAMVTAGTTVVLGIVMTAFYIWVKQQAAGQQRLHCLVGFTGNSAEKLNARFCQCLLCTAANAPADENGDTGVF